MKKKVKVSYSNKKAGFILTCQENISLSSKQVTMIDTEVKFEDILCPRDLACSTVLLLSTVNPRSKLLIVNNIAEYIKGETIKVFVYNMSDTLTELTRDTPIAQGILIDHYKPNYIPVDKA